jgi:NapC/NirT cytochrome c family, N-terminal region
MSEPGTHGPADEPVDAASTGGGGGGGAEAGAGDAEAGAGDRLDGEPAAADLAPGSGEPTPEEAATSAAPVGTTGPEAAAAGTQPPGAAPHKTELDAGIPVDAVEEPAEEEQPPKVLRGRMLSFRIRLPRTRRGLFALLLVVGAFGFASIWTSVSLIHWTETADFCGRCHQMAPELAAYETGPHRDVTCGECHVEPGVTGWVKAKLNGTRQLLQVITGLYPQPIPPPDHDALPSTKDTCQKCHSLDRLAATGLVTRTSFAEDEPNTRSFIGLLIRPGGGDTFDVNRGVHWHVLRDVELWSPDEHSATIDLVAETMANGTVKEYIAQDKIRVAEDVQPEIDAIKATEKSQTMDCTQCHNRVGHPIPNPRYGLDADLSNDRIDPSLPYVKREGMQILWASYPDQETAFAEADKLTGFYELNYPKVASTQAKEIDQAINQIKLLYTLTATPEMKATYASYPEFMGHMDFPGCFRCHDGGHFLVKDGAVTSEVIPYTCDTCHTWPQIGGAVASLPLGQPPTTHDDSLWVFNHKDVATSVDPGGQNCGECHARDYCTNCHQTGAVNVKHAEMATNHAQVIRETGNQACAYCHQPVYCARCHAEPVLPVTSITQAGTPAASPSPTPAPAPQGIRWPLVATGPAATGRTAP